MAGLAAEAGALEEAAEGLKFDLIAITKESAPLFCFRRGDMRLRKVLKVNFAN
jgi:hypothetical protein